MSAHEMTGAAGQQGADALDELDLIRAVLEGFQQCAARSDGLRAVKAVRAALTTVQSSPAEQGNALHAEILECAARLERMAADDRETGESINQAIAAGLGYTPDEATDVAEGLLHAAEHGEGIAALLRKAAALAAHQPQASWRVDEAAVLRRAAATLSMWEDDPNQTGYMGDFNDACQILEVLAQHAAPPAQAVNLGQFRDVVVDWRDRCCQAADKNTIINMAKADRLLALIDSQEVPHG